MPGLVYCWYLMVPPLIDSLLKVTLLSPELRVHRHVIMLREVSFIKLGIFLGYLPRLWISQVKCYSTK